MRLKPIKDLWNWNQEYLESYDDGDSLRDYLSAMVDFPIARNSIGWRYTSYESLAHKALESCTNDEMIAIAAFWGYDTRSRRFTDNLPDMPSVESDDEIHGFMNCRWHWMNPDDEKYIDDMISYHEKAGYDNELELTDDDAPCEEPEEREGEITEPVKNDPPIFMPGEPPKNDFRVIPVTTQSQIENEVKPVLRIGDNEPKSRPASNTKPKEPTCEFKLISKDCPFPLCIWLGDCRAEKCEPGMHPGVCNKELGEPIKDSKAKDEPYITGTTLVPTRRKPPAKIEYEPQYVSTKLRDLHIHVGNVSPNANGDVRIEININLGDM